MNKGVENGVYYKPRQKTDPHIATVVGARWRDAVLVDHKTNLQLRKCERLQEEGKAV